MKSLSAPFQSSHLGMAWKLALLVFFVSVAVVAYSQWNLLVVTIVEWQKALHTLLASHIGAVAENAPKYGGALIALSFCYGVFHAVGPGHGKAVILTYLGTHKESMKRGAVISLSAAILQSLVAIVLVGILARLLKFKLAAVHSYGNDMAAASYIMVIMLGVMLVITAVRRLLSVRRSKSLTEHQESKHGHSHHHNTGCGCSHTHAPEENQSTWQTIAVVISMGFRPCSGAIVVLIYAHLVGVYTYGVIATLLMGIGTGLSVSVIAVGTLYARSWFERFASESYEISIYSRLSVSNYIRFIGGAILVVLGLSLYNATTISTSSHPLF